MTVYYMEYIGYRIYSNSGNPSGSVANSCDVGNNDKETNDSDEELIAAAEWDFKRQVRQPADHVEKLLEVTCPKHAYPVRHKLKECSMMKNYMTMRAFTKGKNPEGDPAERPPHHSLKKRWSCQSTVGLLSTSPGVCSNLQVRRSLPYVRPPGVPSLV
jgi:hypothetical protein